MPWWSRKSKEQKIADKLERKIQEIASILPWKAERRDQLFTGDMYWFILKGGDCDDKANICFRIIISLGFRAKIVHGYTAGQLHAVCLGYIHGKWKIYCNIHGLMDADNYFKLKMTEFYILTDREYQTWIDTRYTPIWEKEKRSSVEDLEQL